MMYMKRIIVNTLSNRCRCFSSLPSSSASTAVTKLDKTLVEVSGEGGHRLSSMAKKILSLKKVIHETEQIEGDKELEALAREEVERVGVELSKLTNQFMLEFIDEDRGGEIMVEVTPGVGGQEAMLFAQEIFDMYLNYGDFKDWEYGLVNCDKTELGGLRNGGVIFSGFEAWSLLQWEGGVHRVQRVPKTEKSGRIHTSTCAVSILKQAKELAIEIPEKDLKMETRRASGAGGQHVNKTESAVRITHIPSGLVVDCQTERSQVQNRATAIKVLKSKLIQSQERKREETTRQLKKSQVGFSERSDKIRTYNYPQDRVTDHRIGKSWFGLKNILSGGDSFDKVLIDVRLAYVESFWK